ncbi:30S ribosomal protein S27ae [Halalkalicoccus jeotgali]|uniref:Small ribosomal subunit protein eS31 n=1 Tax=Halalkalicoccus jeotgali (strain DSM 18796 / CECT 7217 / JCM 14584 / KCTC 4019 / B3) TaxID=795797 RepID=D8J8U9_HALJB|nr:30S ribosomal protein S27ae [Halalkalicoccus jeotgali]ADJ14284.1 30S ribosomal protein S27ae [Halalkalicoccus jeotgali B3]ELY40546.1 30S ribosomal protein S27ae [Halalkalicoccus jeotgali B3]
MARHEIYGEDGSADREQCPRCGDTYLGDYGDRMHCGRCSYTEWQ